MTPARRRPGEEAPTVPIPRETMWEAVERARREMAEGSIELPLPPLDDEEDA